MSALQRFRALCFTIEGINSFAVVIYGNYLYFFLRDHYGFTNKGNLAVAAFLGVVYTFASWQAGKFARRCGYFTSLKIGFSLLAVGLLIGWQVPSLAVVIASAAVASVGMCFIWPVLEALVSEGNVAARAVGIYNITWAITNATAVFIGGTLIEKLGYQSIFYVPFGLMLIQLAMVLGIEKLHARLTLASAASAAPHDPHRPTLEKSRSFQSMAWLANPFAYIAINTLIAVLPGLASKFHLTPMVAGFACSLWCFVRFFAFIALWQWTGWHYRFRWLVTAYVLMVLSFAAILVVPNLAVVLAAQLVFGVTVGLMYYSSLFYAMDAHDAGSEHGGIHEAAIGLGNCIGPAAGAAALQFAAQSPNAGAFAVSGLLVCGLAGLVTIRLRTR
jgi:predicted MFS family arabinose efflux permease